MSKQQKLVTELIQDVELQQPLLSPSERSKLLRASQTRVDAAPALPQPPLTLPHPTESTSSCVAHSTQSLPAGCVVGIPKRDAYPAQPSNAACSVPAWLEDMPPDPVMVWKGAWTLMAWWLASSLASLIMYVTLDMSSGMFLPAMLAAAMGLTVTAMYLGKNFDEGLAGQVRTCRLFAAMAAAMDGLNLVIVDFALLSTAMDCGNIEEPEDCEVALWLALLLTLWLGSHMWLATRVAQRAQHVQRLCDPVSSGIVNLV